jgi:hypothetical protein
MKNVLFGIAITITAASPAFAQAPSSATAVPTPAANAASTAASEVAAKLFPDGTYRRMLGPSFTQMLSSMADSVGTVPIGPLLKAAGLPETDATKLNKTTIGEIMAIVDPAYRERTRRMMDAMFGAMVPMFESLEPDLRAGLAMALDSKFTPAQLAELRSFFATPTGSAYASQQMLLFMDPAVMGRMQAAMPRIMAEMPRFIEAAAASMKDLPKAKTYSDLTPDERARLARLLGLDERKLRK